MRVLHLVEALGGGVAVALEAYIAATPEIDHAVLGSRRAQAETEDALEAVASFEALPTTHIGRLVALTHTLRRMRPDVLHAHSSFAGIYGRPLGPMLGVPVVYTPHCFSFERRDTSGLRRAIYWSIEAALKSSTAVVAAVSPHEAGLAARLPGATPVEYVPHSHLELPPRSRPQSRAGAPLRVVGIGRVCDQKDPAFFAAAAEISRQRGAYDASWSWIGGGDERLTARLVDAGVSVSGWMSHANALSCLAEADIYVHTAAWEGAPLTLLEAAGAGIPIVARSIPAIRSLGVPAGGDRPEDLAAAVQRLGELTARGAAVDEARRWAATFTVERQGEALRRAYRRATMAGRTVTPVVSAG